ncbi:hypothetical protein Cgig2_006445 [Carnegiea gigantea]|uniref:Uncharacterized protein n=1 Tax=Carnegiea gigantea TaxID=171969 RepID=A0A9Q1JL42_9CARY|nr:hypothetical protein Cgig2_006445 [Carnegiea gigantea]
MEFPRSLTMNEMALFMLGNFEWYRREVAFSPRPLLYDYDKLCPGFELCPHITLSDAEEAVCDFELLEMVHATFYAMVLNGAMELDVVSRFLASDLKATLEGLRWTPFESWVHVNRYDLLKVQLYQWTPLGGARGPVSDREASLGGVKPFGKHHLSSHLNLYSERKNDIDIEREGGKTLSCFPTFLAPSREPSTLRFNLLPENHHGLFPDFDLLVAMWYAHNSHIPEMIQAIFYTMALHEAAELGLSSRIVMDCMMSALWVLIWTVIYRESRKSSGEHKFPVLLI